MAKRAEKEDAIEQLLKGLIKAVEQNTIVTLGLRGVPGAKIRALMGGDLNRITKILKQLKGYKAQ
ncbi:MAG: hypothetical protein SFV19_16825 [Rhodospirillaceae bacterium]|nr:hypothetical protein [Rhodospirillaceae bacterium]